MTGFKNWSAATDWERNWWGNCINTLGEEMKQIAHAKCMGLEWQPTEKTKYQINMNGKSVLDIGGGPISLLLRCINVDGTVADPCAYPEWIYERYRVAGIKSDTRKGEDLKFDKVFDEVWMYNVLQHVEDPEKVIKNAKAVGKIVRISDYPFSPALPEHGHPHQLIPELLDQWLGGEGKVEVIDEVALKCYIYHGIFKGDCYDK